MMSLQEIKLPSTILRQYRYKLKIHANLLVALAIVQIIALAFTVLGGTGMSSSSSNSFTVSITHYSGTIILIFTLIWGFVVGILLSVKPASNLDFAFVSNRLSSNLANSAFLLTLSALGGLTIALGSIFLRCIIYFSGRGPDIVGTNFFVPPGDLLLMAFIAVLYLVALSMAGYLVGTMVRRWRILIAVLPALLIGALYLEARIQEVFLILTAAEWLTAESSLGLFVLKILTVSGLAMAGSVVFSQRMEVRQ